MTMTPDAKRALSTTIRALRARLLTDLRDATESTYRLAVRARDAGLDAGARVRRRRLEDWIAEQVRAQGAAARGKALRGADDFRKEVEQRAAYTLLNRLVILRLMEAPGDGGAPPLRSPALVTGGWNSRAYQDFRALAPALCRPSRGTADDDGTEGYAFLLGLVFEDLAADLPGLYGPSGVADLVPVPAATLRHVVDALDDPALASCWTDDMTLGWVYQYWNDPEREALDAKLNGGGKVEPHEIASKTQMFTERYMVDWLLQNSLGPMWLAMCRHHGWTAECEADGTLTALEARRVVWRARREAGEVDPTELMPLETDAERRWAYYVPQPIPDEAVRAAPESVRSLRLLDPAVGSGHFLVVALDLLVALYREEARHRGEVGAHPQAGRWTDRAIVERILTHNLHGVDLDPRAVQIAAAALWLKARRVAPDARPERMNLVASNLSLASLPDDDPALVELRDEVERETGLPGALTDTLVHALRGADHLGSLLRVDRAVEAALDEHERGPRGGGRVLQGSLDLLGDAAPAAVVAREVRPRAEARASLQKRLEDFLARHTTGDDLGLRMRGEQLAAGVRFVRMVREGTYDLVVANPPYQGTSKLADSKYVERHYPLGKADLYAAFLLRGLELVRDDGVSAMLTMRNWMFINQYAALREYLLGTSDLRGLGDFDRGAFEDVPDEVVSVAVSVFTRAAHGAQSIAISPTPRDDRSRDSARTPRKRAATLCHVGRHEFDPAALKVVPEWPLVYWWNTDSLEAYQSTQLVRDVCPARMGANVGDNTRFHRRSFEISSEHGLARDRWPPLVRGAAGKLWFEPAEFVVNWRHNALEIKQRVTTKFGEAGLNWKIANADFYFRRGIAFSMIGAQFSARAHRLPGVFGDKGSSVFPAELHEVLCTMNSTRARSVLESLNPSISFQVGDVNRLPLFSVANAGTIFRTVEAAFNTHEGFREPSVEFRRPGPSPWRHAQEWAQL
ncbi:MAG: BREX-6 system adenine-specific DNA-methyltransferase PglX, partial [Sandaracinaceae bacterium]|nr:BREX-6 system adenine-specific DNA-methyltransferase PglX [Sandaracinaceae bacterium]